MDEIFENVSASEAVAKIKEYEDRQEKTDDEIHVGDEVIFNGKKYIAVYKTKFEGNVIIENNTDALATRAENVKKTGRKYPVAEMLEGLKNDGE